MKVRTNFTSLYHQISRKITFKEGYFTFLIGSTTLNAYQPLTGNENATKQKPLLYVVLAKGGIMYILDCTHGYDKQSLHLATRFPGILNSNDLLATFPQNIWMAIVVSLLSLVVTIMITVSVYMRINPNMVRMNLDGIQIIIRLVAGITEYDDGSWFKTFSTGNLLCLLIRTH